MDESATATLDRLMSASHRMGFRLQVHSRMAHIDSLLGNPEVFSTLRKLRWPTKIVCPRCRSTRIITREKPTQQSIQDKRFKAFYDCLDCANQGRESFFDDLSGLEINEELAELRTWILCWYLGKFCPTALIADYTNLSLDEVTQIIGTMRNLEVESREQEAQRLILDLELRKQDPLPQHTFLLDPQKPTTTEGIELGAVEKRGYEDIRISEKLRHEEAGAHTYEHRASNKKPRPIL